jgi:quinol monooxygenase YgiN
VLPLRHPPANHLLDVPPMQQRDGVTAQAVYRTPGHPNEVIVTHEFASTEAAQRFLQDPDFPQAMKNAGVNSEPTFWLGEQA